MTSTTATSDRTRSTTTSSLGLALPILPGRTPAIRRLLASCASERRTEFDASRRRAGIARDLKWLQSTPVGDFLVRYVEADDAPGAVRHVLSSDHPFDVWYRGELQSCTPVDLSKMGLAPKLIVDFDLGHDGPVHPVAFVVPILPGKEAANLAFAKKLTLDDPGYADLTRRATVVRERVWQHETPHGSFSVLFFEAHDPGQAFMAWGSGQKPFDKFLRQSILDVHGVDLSQPAPPPELLLNYRAG